MAMHAVPIHRLNGPSNDRSSELALLSPSKTAGDDFWFDPFLLDQNDQHIRWLSRPNQQLVLEKYSQDQEKFRITFDVEGFNPDNIKEKSENRYMQKQFEKSYDIPYNADIDVMASYITQLHMLVVEIPLNPQIQRPVEHLAPSQNDQRRLSFSLNKAQEQFQQQQHNQVAHNNSLPLPGSQIRRTSITKTTTTTTTSGDSHHTQGCQNSTERSNAVQSCQSHTGQQQVQSNEKSSSTSANTHSSTLNSSGLANLPIDIPTELLQSGGTITITKRKVSVTKTHDGSEPQITSSSHQTSQNQQHTVSSSQHLPIGQHQQPQQNTTTGIQQSHIHENRSNNQQQQEQQQTNTATNKQSTQSSANNRRMFTLEEFLENKTWNPRIIDGENGEKILYMRLEIKAGIKPEQVQITLKDRDLRVEIGNKATTDTTGRYSNEHSYRQVTLFPTCDINKLKTYFKDDNYLHIEVPIKL
ncbi:unnamed protein product [Didymodactylos carnosus]|uniref:SHSP domain-containing protein n=1 Tax=Didymodactylos carnosus TaxID=1234261 RepID=A0A814NRP0_9BILA|nr:unnamed protein product [Didymodactylos carnosus]CAF1464664.1 unnamed protein product [Didymodactylos carnosus]CAF3861043.1 unnamed protein product [Didymodactylos carnosus]CAF4257535.1 unnamed protein product [Didymodactylos carnosus]